MERIIITHGGYFERFIATLTAKELLKLNYIISLLETSGRVPTKFIKFIREGLYELRMEYNSNIYRVFFMKGKSLFFLMVFRKKHRKPLKQK